MGWRRYENSTSALSPMHSPTADKERKGGQCLGILSLKLGSKIRGDEGVLSTNHVDGSRRVQKSMNHRGCLKSDSARAECSRD